MKEVTTIRLTWDEVVQKVEGLLETVLGKKISFFAFSDHFDYWGIGFCGYRMSIDEFEKICTYVKATEYERAGVIPTPPDNDIGDLGGGIATRILSTALGISVSKILADEDELFLIGCMRNDRNVDAGIVQALRNKKSETNRKLLDTAADEIERLRLELEAKSVINATFVSVWDGGTEIATSCKVNVDTREIFDIEIARTNCNVNNLEREYIRIGDNEYEAFHRDDADMSQDYWYK